jgi:hypothetical protein
MNDYEQHIEEEFKKFLLGAVVATKNLFGGMRWSPDQAYEQSVEHKRAEMLEGINLLEVILEHPIYHKPLEFLLVLAKKFGIGNSSRPWDGIKDINSFRRIYGQNIEAYTERNSFDEARDGDAKGNGRYTPRRVDYRS